LRLLCEGAGVDPKEGDEVSESKDLPMQNETEATRVIERPDGFYWENEASGETYGPFATLEEAIDAMPGGAEGDLEVGETVEEAEAELGISDWIDRDTGLPAEEGVPHLEDD